MGVHYTRPLASYSFCCLDVKASVSFRIHGALPCPASGGPSVPDIEVEISIPSLGQPANPNKNHLDLTVFSLQSLTRSGGTESASIIDVKSPVRTHLRQPSTLPRSAGWSALARPQKYREELHKALAGSKVHKIKHVMCVSCGFVSPLDDRHS